MQSPRSIVETNGFPFHRRLDGAAKRPEMVSFEAEKMNTSHTRLPSLAFRLQNRNTELDRSR
jgi:hypothetical protein